MLNSAVEIFARPFYGLMSLRIVFYNSGQRRKGRTVDSAKDKMHLFDQRILGIAILFLLGMLVSIKKAATHSILDKPRGILLVQLVNIFNLLFLLAVNPVVAVALITRHLATIDPTRIVINNPLILSVFEIAGLLEYVAGFFLMAGVLVALGRNYQLGGSAPRSEDRMVESGPYRLIRHPMYAAALGFSLGLACLTQSGALFCVFCVYLVLILLLVPVEEKGLQKAYGEQFIAYRQDSRKVIPFVY